MTHSGDIFWPYEQRFELMTEGDLRTLPDAVWPMVARDAGTQIVKEGRAPSCRHFILALSSLFVFQNRVVLISCAPNGVLTAANNLLSLTAELNPQYATIERRLPLGKFSRFGKKFVNADEDRLPPLWGQSEGASLHRWSLADEWLPSASTLVILMHDLAGACDLLDARTALKSYFPDFLTAGHQFDATSFSFNSVSDESYITMHYSPGVYASLECSLTDWKPLDEFLAHILTLCRPDIVAPLWHGEPIIDFDVHADEAADAR